MISFKDGDAAAFAAAAPPPPQVITLLLSTIIKVRFNGSSISRRKPRDLETVTLGLHLTDILLLPVHWERDLSFQVPGAPVLSLFLLLHAKLNHILWNHRDKSTGSGSYRQKQHLRQVSKSHGWYVRNRLSREKDTGLRRISSGM
ncbi:hypothetical protein RUM43_007832 [Polyplax serrata]|uniref:Uncharacterized protein n=1 Tax=Polyplax serrata TaxID=468196 RepID=A0AAN8S8U0_POLSC